MEILLINGPNLNMLGTRQPEFYGYDTLAMIEQNVKTIIEAEQGCKLTVFQSNHEGKLIDKIQEHKACSGIIINPGGLTHTSLSLLDALLAIAKPFVEVHLSNLFERPGREHSCFSSNAIAVISGCKANGYQYAAHYLLHHLHKERNK